MKQMSDGTRKALTIFNVALVIITFVLLIIRIPQVTGVRLVANLIDALALLAAALYCILGYKKSAAAYYKFFVILFGASILVGVYARASAGNALSSAITSITFGAICILAVSKDLGKKKSLVIGFIAFVTSVYIVVSWALAGMDFFGPMLSSIAELLMTIILNLSILGKYADKAERGTT